MYIICVIESFFFCQVNPLGRGHFSRWSLIALLGTPSHSLFKKEIKPQAYTSSSRHYRGPNWDPSLKPLQTSQRQCGTPIGSVTPLNWASIMPRDASFSDIGWEFFFCSVWKARLYRDLLATSGQTWIGEWFTWHFVLIIFNVLFWTFFVVILNIFLWLYLTFYFDYFYHFVLVIFNILFWTFCCGYFQHFIVILNILLLLF